MILFSIISNIVMVFLTYYFYKQTKHFDNSKERKRLIEKINNMEQDIKECKQILKS